MPAATDQPVSDSLLLAIQRVTVQALREGHTTLGLMLEATLNLGNDFNVPDRQAAVPRRSVYAVTQVRDVHAVM